MDTVKRLQNVHCDIDCQWRSVHRRGDTSVRSRSESVRNRVTTRGNVCCPVVGQALRRPRILFWVGQLSKVTIEWMKGRLTFCKTVNFVSLVVPGISFISESVSSSTISISGLVAKRDRNSIQETDAICLKFIFTFSIRVEFQNQNKKKDDKKYSDDVLTDLPEWLKEFKENLMDRELSASAHSPQESDLEHYLNYDVCFSNKSDKGSLKKTHWRRSTSCRKVRRLDNDWSQSPQRGRWISKQSSIRSREVRSCHSMDSILSVQNKIFTWDIKKFV